MEQRTMGGSRAEKSRGMKQQEKMCFSLIIVVEVAAQILSYFNREEVFPQMSFQ